MRYLKQQIEPLETEIHPLKVSATDILGKLHKVVSRMANSLLMHSRARDGHGTLNILPRSVAHEWTTLTASPKSPHTLWLEYQHGISGRKPVKSFTPVKRGRVKQKYCTRKPFWELITKMVQRGFTSQVAIDKIYRQPRSITKILREIRKDIFTFFNILCDTGLLLH